MDFPLNNFLPTPRMSLESQTSKLNNNEDPEETFQLSTTKPHMHSTPEVHQPQPQSFQRLHSRAEVQFNEEDLWSIKIIISALEDLVLTNSSHPRISPQLFQSLQNSLSSLKNDLPSNPFIKNTNDFLESKSNKEEEKDLLNDIPSDARLVIKSLVSIHIRQMAKNIINIYSPLLKLNDKTEASNYGDNNEEQHILEGLKKVKELLQNMGDEDLTLSKEIVDMKVQLQMELDNYSKEIKELDTILSKILEVAVQENQSDKVAAFVDYLKRENENVFLKLEIVKLEQETEMSPPALTAELQEQYDKLAEAVKALEVECDEKTKLLNEYNVLGEPYTCLLEEYKMQEEDIKTKEWVKEQLTNAAADRSLMSSTLSDSFF